MVCGPYSAAFSSCDCPGEKSCCDEKKGVNPAGTMADVHSKDWLKNWCLSGRKIVVRVLDSPLSTRFARGVWGALRLAFD